MDALIHRLLVARITGQVTPDLVDSMLNLLPHAVTHRERIAARNRFLAQAVEHFQGSPWQRCTALAKALRTYSGHPVDPVRELIWKAEQTGTSIRLATDTLYAILYEKGGLLVES